MGVVEEVGPEVTNLKKGDRVIIPFNVACGNCWYCTHDLTSQCDNGNPYWQGPDSLVIQKWRTVLK